MSMIPSPLFEGIRKYFSESDPNDTIFLFVPYIKTKALESLLASISNKIVIITTWNPKDIMFGSSELELWPFCKDNGITLYVISNMHLKIYSVELQSAILATANISNRGLFPNGNYEAGVYLNQLKNEDRLYLESIRKKARLVDDAMYQNLKKWHNEEKIKIEKIPSFEDIVPVLNNNNFSIAALPMTLKINDLIVGYARINEGKLPSKNSETASCIFHDIANYAIPLGLSKEELLKELKNKFYAHPFIQKINSNIDPEVYFGEIKVWIQDNCTDVPVPSRRTLTENVKVLFEWFVSLGNGKYVKDVPGSHSERLRRL